MSLLAQWGWLIALAVNGFTALLVLVLRGSFAGREEHRGVLERLTRIEAELKHVPSAGALHELSTAVVRMAGDLKVVATRMDDVDRLSARVERMIERQEDWLKSRPS